MRRIRKFDLFIEESFVIHNKPCSPTVLSADLGFSMLRVAFVLGLVLGASPSFAERIRFSFDATLERVVAPRGETLLSSLSVGTLASGVIEIAIPAPGDANTTPVKGNDSGSIWADVVVRVTLSGGFNASFHGGGVYFDSRKAVAYNSRYAGNALVCAGQKNNCGGEGDGFNSRTSDLTVRSLRPISFSFTHNEGHGERGYSDWSLSRVVQRLAGEASKDKTSLVIDLAERGKEAKRREHNAKMLWRITKSNLVR